MTKYLSILALLLTTGCASIFHGGSSWRGDDYKVDPQNFRDLVESERLRAEAEMLPLGHVPRHKIRKVEIKHGTARYRNRWVVPAKTSTGFAGGMCLSQTIWIVADTEAVMRERARHEWKHAILMANFYPGDLDTQHAEIRRSER